MTPLRRLAARAEFDATVAWALGVRFWQVLAGPVTALLIAARLSASGRDYFYTLTGLLGLDALCSLGLGPVLISLTAHEWAGGAPPAANRRRLAGLTRFAARWAVGSAAAFAVGVGAFGWWTFASSEPAANSAAAVGWAGPWGVAAAATAGSVAVAPAFAVLTGCGRVGAVTRTQTLAAVAANLAAWATLIAGGGLWAAAAACGGRLAVELALLARTRGFLSQIAGRERGIEEVKPDGSGWLSAVWPMQWRAAVQTTTASAAAAGLTLVLFRHRDALGAGEAGRLGMSWSAALALQFAGQAWLGTRAPRLGAFAAAGDRAGFDRLFARTFFASGAAVAGGAVVGTALLWGLNRFGFALAEALLPVAPFAALAGGSVALHVPLSLAAYARAWRAEAFVLPAAALWAAVGLMTWGLGPAFGAAGVAWGFAAAVGVVGVPLYLGRWARWRRRLP